MFRILSVLVLLTFYFMASSQTREAFIIQSQKDHTEIKKGKSDGDTLMFFDGRDFILKDTADQNAFTYENSDYDSLYPQNANYPLAYELSAYSTDAGNFLPGDVDTSWFIYATSWFAPSGQADNWFTYGPISIPSGGADLSWYEKHHPQWSDSYQVLISTQGYQAYIDIIPGQNIQLYNRVQISPPTVQTANDTIWTQNSVTLDAFAGEKIYLGFQHNANDGDVLYLDNMLIVEANRVGLEELNPKRFSLDQNFPNPAEAITSISYKLEKSGLVNFSLNNILGETIYSKNLGTQIKGIHTFDLNSNLYPVGVYFYSIEVDGYRQSRKMIIQ